MSSVRVLGGGPDPFSRPSRNLDSAGVLRALSLDPYHDVDHARLDAIRRQLEARRGLGEPTREQQLLEWSLQVEPKRPEMRTYDNPARLSDHERTQRALSQGDLEFVRSFGDVEPDKVPAEDVRLLAELEVVAQSESERRLVSRVLAPIRRFHDRKEEEAGLLTELDRNAPSPWRSDVVRDTWAPVLAERLAEEARARLVPQLEGISAEVRDTTLRGVEADAHAEAQRQIRELWSTLNTEANANANVARERLSALASGADPASSSAVRSEPDAAGLEDARRRGREAREPLQAEADAFADFRMLA